MPKKKQYEVVAEFHHPPMSISPISECEVVGIMRVEEVHWKFKANDNDEAVSQAQKKLRSLVEQFLARMIENKKGDEPSSEEQQEVFGKIMQHCVKIKKVRQIDGDPSANKKKISLEGVLLSALVGVLIFLILWCLIF